MNGLKERSGPDWRLLLLAIWIETAIVGLIMYWAKLPDLGFGDPDDAMRLTQVRDFLAGQSWFDVSQHRANPPLGGPMHWSRLVDLPIAGLIMLLRPILGVHWAEVVACVTVPLLTFGLLLVVFYQAMRHHIGVAGALVCCVLLATSPIILVQMTPLRIDHHGWQIVMACLAIGGVLMTQARRGGTIAGLAMALGLHISSEGLPLAALIGAVIVVRYAFDAREWPRLSGYVWMLTGGSAFLLLLTHGWRASLVSYCDAMSPVYLAPLGVMLAFTIMGHRMLGTGAMLRRIVPVGVGAMLGAILFAGIAGPCLAGPFRTLDPLVYQIWYLAVMEGLPIWMQSPAMALMVIAPSVLGIIGLVLAARQEQDADTRRNWLSLLALAMGACVVALLVMRAASVAHLLALPGNAWIIIRLYRRIRAFTASYARIFATVALSALSPIGLDMVAVAVLVQDDGEQPEIADAMRPQEISTLNHIPASVLFTPLDIGPDVLVRTPHAVIGTGHHRNAAGMKQVIGAFLAPPDRARDIVFASSARYLLTTPGTNEEGRYVRSSPGGLMAAMQRNQIPSWLERVHVPGMKTLRLYRIIRPGTSSPRR